MTLRTASSLLFAPLASAAIALAIAACSSSSPAPTAACTAGETSTCACPDGTSGTQKCGESACTCAEADAGADAGHIGDGGHVSEGAAPETIYGACAVQGSFGWPCTQPDTNDTTNCTDPRFPFCFGGGQGYWCTAECGDAGFSAACGAETTGCAPTACNARGYCK